MDETDLAKIRIYEQYSRGEKTEREVRELLGDDVVDSMREESKAFESAMKLDTSGFLSSDGG